MNLNKRIVITDNSGYLEVYDLTNNKTYKVNYIIEGSVMNCYEEISIYKLNRKVEFLSKEYQVYYY